MKEITRDWVRREGRRKGIERQGRCKREEQCKMKSERLREWQTGVSPLGISFDIDL